jgi:HPt (histidine-containing phosphotransfer) domain-containing protein
MAMIDFEKLSVHFDNDLEMFSELVVVFDETYPGTLEQIKTAAETGSFEDLDLHAHTLKGMVANFYVESLRTHALALETMGKNKSTDGWEQHYQALEKGLPLIIKDLKKHTSKKSA